MAFVELESGDWLNADFVEEIYKRDAGSEYWEAGMNHGESVSITDADRIKILKTAGFVKIKKEKNDE